MYTPQIAREILSPEDVRLWVQEELRQIAAEMQQLEVPQFRILHVEPAKRADGMVVYADGANWNPGSGAGLYERVAGVWVKLALPPYTDEMAQDAVGTILTDSGTIDFTYDDGANTITAIVKTGSINLTSHVTGLLPIANLAGHPTTTTDNALVRFDGTGGNTQNQTLVTLGDTGSLISVPGAAVVAFDATLNSAIGARFSGTPHSGAGFIHILPNAGSPGYIAFGEATVADRWAIGITNGSGDLNFRQGTATGTIRFAMTSAGLLTMSGYGSGALSSDSSGNVGSSTLSVANGGTGVTAQPAFSVHRNGSAQAIATGLGTPVKIQFTTEDFDTNSNFDNATNYRFTPTVAGKYLISLNVFILSMTVGLVMDAYIYKNGAAYKLNEFIAPGTFNIGGCVTAVIDFNGSTDYVEFFVAHNFGSDRNISGASTVTFATGVRCA